MFFFDSFACCTGADRSVVVVITERITNLDHLYVLLPCVYLRGEIADTGGGVREKYLGKVMETSINSINHMEERTKT